MRRPPCCEKFGVKKGPWTPEEDIILVSYVQEHGPGNWRSVPANTGLLRCSKSCRLRWTNYLRPGIKRGNFSVQEEKLIVHLQALLGNRWATTASYLPERTDNDIKNYWNTHLKKKLQKLDNNNNTISNNIHQPNPKGQWERRLQTDINLAKRALNEALRINNSTDTITSPTSTSPSSSSSSSSTYASSTENISRLLEGWMSSRKPTNSVEVSGTESKDASLGGQEPLSLIETWFVGDGFGGEDNEGLFDLSVDNVACGMF